MNGAEARVFRAFLEQSTGFKIPEDRWKFLAPKFLSRLDDRGFEGIHSYLSYLERDPLGRNELEEIFCILTVRKTSFFRNPAMFDALAQEIFPNLLIGRPRQLPVTIWSAGCATGEEPYSTAMVAEEALGPEIQKYFLATDIVNDALQKARIGSYKNKALSSVPPEYRGFFEEAGGRVRVKQRLRDSIEFLEHNLVHDPMPVSAIGTWDVILCRNVFIYFAMEQAKHILGKLVSVLTPGGALILGHAEAFPAMHDRLEVVFWGETYYYRKRPDPRVQPVRADTPPLASVRRPMAETRAVARPNRTKLPTRSMDRTQEQDRTRAERRERISRRVEEETRNLKRRSGDRITLPRDLLAQAHRMRQAGDLDGACRALRAAAAKAPQWPQPRILLAEIYLGRREMAHAMQELEMAVEIAPLEAKAHYYLGIAHAAIQGHALAELSFRRALYLDPDDLAARYHLAQTYRELSQTDRACRELRILLRSLRKRKPEVIPLYEDPCPSEQFRKRCEKEITGMGGSLMDSGIWQWPPVG